MLDVARQADTLLELRDVKVSFTLKHSGLFGRSAELRAVDGVSLVVHKSQTMGIVGESGSGKTTLALAVARLVTVTDGQIDMNGVDLLSLNGEALRKIRHSMQFIFQDPYSSLNPRLRASKIVRETLDRLEIGSASSRDERVKELFDQVGLRREQLQLFPHQFSGGQRQRIGIARAIASNPALVICDEPVSALDVGVQAQILNL
ncbi:MAG: dipeptide/oligopeptide/nickel ABC transporter ATP-binding protein, partial [Arenicellales bacterium]|nr:dipeptide/oligopeptide/nickel ABC transporter ATP-binding protein [Arenicellales bacterium]